MADRVDFAPHRPGRLSPYQRALLEDTAESLGIPVLTVVKGSYAGTDGLSADTHGRGGAGDIGRVWEIGGWADLERLVHALRARGCAAWVRDKQHGGFDPHIHFICPADGDLSPGARWQVQQYELGRDGLARRGADYHPFRPPLTRWEIPDMDLTDRLPVPSSLVGVIGGPDLTVAEALVRTLAVVKRLEQAEAARAGATAAAIGAAVAGLDPVAVEAAARAGAEAALAGFRAEVTISSATSSTP